MKDTLYFVHTKMDEALGLLDQYGAKATILAGGTDLLPKINQYELRPDVLVYIGELGLDYIREKDGKLVIGATTPMAKIAASELVAGKAGALAEAARRSGTTAVRTTATIGGNLANASPAADLATPLLAMDAELLLISKKGKRTVALKDFFQGPGKSVLQPGELIVEVSLPPPRGKTVFLKLGRRKALTLSVVNVAVRLELDGQKCKEARIALGSVAPTPLRCPGAEGLLRDQKVDPGLISRCAAEAMAASKPVDDQRASAWYRKQAGTALVARALRQAAGLKSE
jgi:CO/xanthine dehydrogenase FAD-binding subunit